AFQGPNFTKLVEAGMDGAEKILALRRFGFVQLDWRGKNILISRTGYTGEDGIEVYGPTDCAADWLNELWERLGDENRPALCGLGCRDSLRLEAGLPLYGHELSDTISPLEAGIGWTV